MTAQSVERGVYASLSVTIFTTAGDKEAMSQDIKRFESEQLVMGEISPQDTLEAAEIAQSVSMKVSDAVFWGGGTWDKIPFSVEVFSSVKLRCAQDAEKIGMAQELAHDMAVVGARSHMGSALGSHIQNIKVNLFPGYFKDA